MKSLKEVFVNEGGKTYADGSPIPTNKELEDLWKKGDAMLKKSLPGWHWEGLALRGRTEFRWSSFGPPSDIIDFEAEATLNVRTMTWEIDTGFGKGEGKLQG